MPPKYKFALVEICDANKEFVYFAFSSASPDISEEEFLEKVNREIGCNPDSENSKVKTHYGNLFSVVSRKTASPPPNASVHFCTGRYGLVGFGQRVAFDQRTLLRLLRDDDRPRTIRAVPVSLI